MNLRNKMLFATLLASSGLILTTQGVKAETTKTDSQINQSITQSSNQSIQENPTTLNGVSRTNSDVSQERSQTINSAEVSTQNPRQQESDEKN
ncbi:hypothetical protein FHL06_08515 [Lactobacillus halodurans]|nr:hypothetical protein [Companilactobacillus halodurans]MQS76419.1 hypothetical protein [Companilactobacillus halodurans]